MRWWESGRHVTWSPAGLNEVLLLPLQVGQPCMVTALWKEGMASKRTIFPGVKTVSCELLVEQKMLQPRIHIKLMLMKNFVMALIRDWKAFEYLFQKFPPRLNEAKIKESIFVGSHKAHIRNLMKDRSDEISIHFWRTQKARVSLKSVSQNFLVNRTPNTVELVDNKLKAHV